MRRILVTGGAGFIGSAFVREFHRDFELLVIDNLDYSGDALRIRETGVPLLEVDIRDKETLMEVVEDFHPDAIVHFAAQTHVDRSIVDPEPFFSTNVMGTLNLLQTALETGVGRFIHISTDEVYGDLPPGSDEKFTEESPLRPSSPYSSSKASADLMVQSFVRTYGLPVLIVRPSNCYGPWQYPEKLIPYSILRLLNGEPIALYGRGENIRTWLHVDDCVRGIRIVMERGEIGEIYNLGSDEERRNIDVARLIVRYMGLDENWIEFVNDRPGHDFRYALNTSKIRSLGWEPEINFEEGLRETVRWYIENREWLELKYSEVAGFVRRWQHRALKFLNKHK